jgi:twitching motility protein PilT
MPKAIHRLFDQLLKRKGSDLHLAVGYPPLVRVHGDLVPLDQPPFGVADLNALLFEIASPEQRRQAEEEHDLDFAYAYGTKARFRANYFSRHSGIGAVFRTIPTKVLSLEDLACPPVVRTLAERRSGLILVTGPTGSGKSTTLAAMISHINSTRACHILTVEDPVEFVHEPRRAQVTHREVGAHASSFAAAIRSAGRENPDVILIGELRGNETMKLALQLASFGILVFATVHTNSASSTIDRIINAFPADEQPQVRGMLAEGLAGIVAQQLLKTADGQGRCAAHEVLVGTGAISSLIREGKIFQIASAMQTGQTVGMQTMDMALMRLLAAGRISVEAAIEKASDKEAFHRVAKGAVPTG